MGAVQKSFEKREGNESRPFVHHVDHSMDVVRRSFERWAGNEGHPLVRHADGSYVYEDVERDWHLWRIAVMYNGTPN